MRKCTYVCIKHNNQYMEETDFNDIFPAQAWLREIERMKNTRYKTYDANNYSYDFDFKWINKNTLLVQYYSSEARNHYEDICELWLYEEKDGSVDVYKFTSKNLPD
ncbi:hypothetical protein [uncultured Campylobacter sp.]|uniref:hypothetical protein n=1 Tax=uncultured Campylobacter sp. TaxID=218934 RepID=UPI003211B23D